MKSLIVFTTLFAISMAQRPTYAGSSPIGQPGLASRFKETSDESSTEVPLANRLGEGGTTVKLPVDARGDEGLVNRLNQWPQENRPFWLINAQHIEAHRQTGGNDGGNRGAATGQAQQGTNQLASRSSLNEFDTVVESRPIRPTPPRSSFLGPLER